MRWLVFLSAVQFSCSPDSWEQTEKNEDKLILTKILHSALIFSDVNIWWVHQWNKKNDKERRDRLLHRSWAKSHPATLNIAFLSYIKFIFLNSNSCSKIWTTHTAVYDETGESLSVKSTDQLSSPNQVNKQNVIFVQIQKGRVWSAVSMCYVENVTWPVRKVE